MKRADARIIEGPHTFARDQVTLAVRDDTGAYLMADGTWFRPAEGATVEGMGLVLPSHVIETIAVAIAEWQGHTSHADTEARVLREWLAVERARVEKVLAR